MKIANAHPTDSSYFISNYPTLYKLFDRMVGCGSMAILAHQRDANREPSYRRYLNNYYVQQGMAAGSFVLKGGLQIAQRVAQTTVGQKLIELVFAKKRLECIKMTAQFFHPYFGYEKGKKFYTACLLVICALNVFQSYLLMFLVGDAFLKINELRAKETVTKEDVYGAVHYNIFLLLMEFGIVHFRKVTEKWLRNAISQEVCCKYLEALKQNNGFYGVNLLQKKTTSNDTTVMAQFIQSIKGVDSSFTTFFYSIESVIVQVMQFYYLLSVDKFLIIAGVLYGLTIKPLLDHFIQKFVSNTVEEETRLTEQFGEELNQLSFCNESIALKNGSASAIDSIKKISAKTLKNKNKQLLLDIYTDFHSKQTHIIALLLTTYVLIDQLVSKAISISDFIKTQQGLAGIIHILSRDQSCNDGIIRAEKCFKTLSNIQQKINTWNTLIEKRSLTIQYGETVTFKSKIELPLENGESRTIVDIKEPITFESGNWYRIDGSSGSGKTTIFRVLAGLWPYVEGELTIPEKTEFLPQEPFIPAIPTTLADILRFPEGKEFSTDEETEIKNMMVDLGLEFSLDVKANWASILSRGQKQKIALIAALIKKPKCLILDEPTASMDIKNQDKVQHLISKKLPEAIVIYTDHHPLAKNKNEIVYRITAEHELKRM